MKFVRVKVAVSRRSVTKRVVVGLVALGLIASACGGDDGAADDELISAIEAAMLQEAPPAGFEYDANCMATGMVANLGGAEQIEADYGLTAELVRGGRDIDDFNLEEQDAIDMTESIWECSDFTGLISSSFATEGMNSEQAACLTAKVPEDAVKKMIAASFMGAAGTTLEDEAGEELFGSMFAAAQECGVG